MIDPTHRIELRQTFGRHAEIIPTTRHRGRSIPAGRVATVAIAAVIALAGCASSTPSVSGLPGSTGPGPGASTADAPSTAPSAAVASASTPPRVPVVGLDWRAAADVARPEDAFPVSSDPPTGPAGPGTAGHPSHFPGQATIADVIVAGDRLLAVGYVGWEWRPVAWASKDADHWSLIEIGRPDPDDFSFAVSVAATPGGGVVAVGRSGNRPVAWTSADGATWAVHDVTTLGRPGEAERMTVVASGPDGMLAGGSVGPELLERHARLWRSPDGATWTPVPDDPAFDGAEVTALIPVDDGWLALGRIGTGQRTSGSVAWRSPDGKRWTRIDDPALAKGWVRAVTRAADGSVVAVGSEPDEIGAYTWRSTDDGRSWTLAPESESLTHHGQKIRMTDVTTTPDGLLAVGNLVGVQYGDGASWRSADAVTWERSPFQPAMGQVEPAAVVRFGDRDVMVGTFGAPDDYIPRVWVSPPS